MTFGAEKRLLWIDSKSGKISSPLAFPCIPFVDHRRQHHITPVSEGWWSKVAIFQPKWSLHVEFSQKNQKRVRDIGYHFEAVTAGFYRKNSTIPVYVLPQIGPKTIAKYL